MLSLLLAAAAANAPVSPDARVSAATPATATVRILRAAEIRAGKLSAGEGSVLRATELRESDGLVRRASLVEYY
jgi:hypothetical protein